MYTVDARNAQILLRYSDVFSDSKPDLIERIRLLNMHKAISIISELIQVRNAECDPVRICGLEFIFPFEATLKRDYCGIEPKSLTDLLENSNLRNDVHIISLQMLLLLLKKILAYGDQSSIADAEYTITDDDYKEIIRLQLVVAEDAALHKESDSLDINHFIYSTYHLNYQRNVANIFLRMYYMMECLSKDRNNFDEDVQKEYRDYYGDFQKKYGFTPTDYSSFLFGELYFYYRKKNYLCNSSLWRDVPSIYKNSPNQECISRVIDLLKRPPSEYKEWATQTTTAAWDFTKFMEFPFIADTTSRYISISEVSLINAFFEKLFWLIRDCYPKDDGSAMAFFGRLFERYIQDLTENACKDPYAFIGEFSVGKREERKSSDAYIRRSNNLLAVEAKGFSVLVDCMAKNENIERNNEKLFIKPVLQADKFLSNVFKQVNKFSGVDSIYIISVTMDNINAVPNYYQNIYQEIATKKKCSHVRYYFNLSIEEYEMLMCLIEKGVNVFPLLKSYFEKDTLAPFSNYLREKYPRIEMTSFMERCYNDAASKMKSLLFGQETD